MAPNKFPDQNAPGSGFGIQDVLYVLFKHKWKIILLALLGFGAAAGLYVKQRPVYASQAKLLIKYVFAHSDDGTWELQENAGGRAGDYIADAEIAILTSWDLARDVVETVGVEHFVGDEEKKEGEDLAAKDGGEEGVADQPGDAKPSEATGTDAESEEDASAQRTGKDPRIASAAGVFLSNLQVESAGGGKILQIEYRHGDPQLVQRVLNTFVDRYFEKHLSIYRPVRIDLANLKDEETTLRLALPGQRTSLRTMQEQLRDTSRGDTTEFLKAQRGAVQGGLLQAQADFAQQKMVVEMLRAGPEPDGKAPAKKPGADDAPAANPIPVPNPQVVQEFQALLAQDNILQRKKLELAGKFRPGIGGLVPIGAQIRENQDKRQALIAKHPGLVAAAVAQRAADGGQIDLRAEVAQLAALEAKVKTYEAQLKSLEDRFFALSKLESEIAAVTLEIEEGTQTLGVLAERLKVAEREQKIDHRNMPNIDIVQHPSDPAKTIDKKAMKLILGVAGSGLALGLALAFLLELVVDRRVKRPIEIETRMRMPLLLTIPKLGNGAKVPRLAYANGDADEAEDMYLLPSDKRDSGRADQILPYAEAIRDRLLYYFELNEMRHMPKLIALTGLSDGAGASTLAAGVATAFARAEAKVLLVDLHSDQQGCGGLIATHGNGKRATSVAINGGEGMKFNTAGLNLSLASFGGRTTGNGASTLAPKKFYELIPKFRSSDFDYVIFDMPAIGATSSTSAMAGFMDKVVLVLDAENTDRDDLKRGYTDLVRGKADVSCVFNKTRTHAPRWVAG